MNKRALSPAKSQASAVSSTASARAKGSVKPGPRKAPAQQGSRRPSDAVLNSFLSKQLGTPWVQGTQALKDRFASSQVTVEFLLKIVDVATRTVLRDGKVRVQHELDGLIGLEAAQQRFYVHPQSKILCLNEARVQKEQQARAQQQRIEQKAKALRKDLTEQLQAHKLVDKWIVVELVPLESSGFDVLLGRQVTPHDRSELMATYGHAGVYAHEKRELSYREKLVLKLE